MRLTLHGPGELEAGRAWFQRSGTVTFEALFLFPPCAETRVDRSKKLFRHYTVGSYDSFEASR